MASPVVSGAVALMLGENPYLTPPQVESIIKNTSFNYRNLQGLVENGGYLNLAGALEVASAAAESNVIRLYNPSQNKHLFSSSKYEIDLLTGNGWKDEGVIYYAPKDNTVDVFRFYIASENRHFYTALESERDLIINNPELAAAGWQYEGAAFRAYSSSDYSEEATAIVRYYNLETGSHVYSTSAYEQNLLNENSTWLNEGIAWFGEEQPVVI